MDSSSSISEQQLRKDKEHLNLLSIFHFVLGGLALLGIAFLLLHYFIMHSFFADPNMWKSKTGAGPSGPPPQFFMVITWFYVFAGIAITLACLANILSGVFLHQRKHRVFSLIVAGLNCFQFPFGTALGVFTLIVLLRDSVRQSYHSP